MKTRGIRGAITVDANEENAILDGTLLLMKEIIAANRLQPDDIACIWITVTQDLDAAFPAKAIRQVEGWELVPLMCAVEMSVKGSLERCIRLMVLVNTEMSQAEIRHVYLGGAKILRPDLAKS